MHKIFVREGCSHCTKLKENIPGFAENRIEIIDIDKDYNGLRPESVPVLQNKYQTLMGGQQITDYLNFFYS